jgi:hypothetical protein
MCLTGPPIAERLFWEVVAVSSRPSVFLAVSLLVCICVLLSGCAGGNLIGPPTGQATALKISGVVHGGQNPISGATIQLYATNTTADKGASTAMISSTVTTGPDGSFTITGDYSCVTLGNPQVYLVSTGGNPGLTGTVDNTDITLMAELGTCSSLTSSTYVVINELTTLVSVEALAPFMADATHIGESPTNPVSMAGAMKEFTSLGSFSSGNFPSLDSQILELQFNTFANILAACVNTTGGASGSATPCGQLLSLTGATDTATAALHIAQSPTSQMSGLYALITGTPPFQPYYSSLPNDLSVTVGSPLPFDEYSLPNVDVALDSNSHIWVYYGGYTYTPPPVPPLGATGTSTDVQGMIVVYDINFNQLFTVPAGTGGLYYPDTLAADASGHVFAVNANNTISEFSSTGGAISPSTGWPTGITPSFSPTGTGNAYQRNTNQVGPVRVDALGNMWGKVPFGSSGCYFELNSSGTAITPSPSNTAAFCAATGGISSLVPDGSGNAWAYGFSAIVEVNSTGGVANTAPATTGCMDPSGTTNVQTNAILYDHAHNQLWGYSDTGAGAITDGGSNLFCDEGATTLPVIAPYTNSTGVGNPYSTGALLIQNGVLDGAGNFWFLTNGVAATGTETNTTGTFTGTATYNTYLSEINSSGALVTSYNASSQVFGLTEPGMGLSGTGTSVNNASVYTQGTSATILGIDSSGDILVLDNQSFRVIKISGLATANTMNY